MHIDVIERTWDALSTGGSGPSDGVVTGPSQVYPNAMRNYTRPDGDSHLGETQSTATRTVLDEVLRRELGIAYRGEGGV